MLWKLNALFADIMSHIRQASRLAGRRSPTDGWKPGLYFANNATCSDTVFRMNVLSIANPVFIEYAQILVVTTGREANMNAETRGGEDMTLACYAATRYRIGLAGSKSSCQCPITGLPFDLRLPEAPLCRLLPRFLAYERDVKTWFLLSLGTNCGVSCRGCSDVGFCFHSDI